VGWEQGSATTSQLRKSKPKNEKNIKDGGFAFTCDFLPLDSVRSVPGGLVIEPCLGILSTLLTRTTIWKLLSNSLAVFTILKLTSPDAYSIHNAYSAWYLCSDLLENPSRC
jgi:hypothetical protein